MKPGAVVALCLAMAGAALSVGVAVHEWSYHEDHPGRTGVSGVLTVVKFAQLELGAGRLDETQTRSVA